MEEEKFATQISNQSASPSFASKKQNYVSQENLHNLNLNDQYLKAAKVRIG